jgi:DNA gyrase/topoisomerase IV subunit A
MIVTGNGQGFRFERDMLMEPTKRTGRRFVNLKGNDRVLGVDHERELIAIVTTDAKILAYPSERISLLSGPAQGVRLIMLAQNAQVAAFYSMAPDDQLILVPKRGKERVIKATELPTANRGTRGKVLLEGLKETRIAKSQGGAEI